MRLWIHIGMPKTGTSTIQSYLADNRVLLKRSGIVSLTPQRNHASANRLAAALRGHKTHDPVTVAQACFSLIGTEGAEDAILSSEELYLNNPTRLAEVLEPHVKAHSAKVGIICYFRRQDQFVGSFYSQRRKVRRFQGDLKDFVTFCETQDLNYLDYASVIDQWKAAFPQATFYPRRFDRARFEGGSLIDDFMHAIGRSAVLNEGRAPDPSVNSAPNQDVIELIDLLAETGKFNLTRIYRSMEKKGFPETGARVEFMDAKTRDWLLATYADSNERLRSKYFPEDETLFSPILSSLDRRPKTTFTPAQKDLLRLWIKAVVSTKF